MDYSKISQIVNTTDTWTFLDENPLSINDGGFKTYMVLPTATTADLVDVPAGYHNNATGMSFADGHSTIHKWSSSYTTMTTRPGSAKTNPAFVSDIIWLSSVTTALIN